MVLDPDRQHGGAGGGGDPAAAAVAYLGWTGSLGRLDLRAQIGLGFGATGGAAHSRLPGDVPPIARSTGGGAPIPSQPDRGPGGDGGGRFTPRAEASILVGLPLTEHLGLVGGPVVTSSDLDRALADHGHDPAVDVTLFAGLRFRR